MKTYPYYNIADGITYAIKTKSQEEADKAMCMYVRKMAGYNQQKFQEMIKLICAEKPVSVKKGQEAFVKGKYKEIA